MLTQILRRRSISSANEAKHDVDEILLSDIDEEDARRWREKKLFEAANFGEDTIYDDQQESPEGSSYS